MSSETGWQRLISLAFAAWGPTFQEIRWYFGAIQRKSSYLTTWLSRLSLPESRHISLNGLACQHIVCRKTQAAWQPQMLLFLNHCFCRCSGAQEAISSSLGKRRDGWIRENDDGDALNWALGDRRDCRDVLWSESGLPACLVCHCSLHSSNFSIEKQEHMTFISVLFSLPSLSCAWTAIRRPRVRQAEWDSWKEYSSSITQTVGVYFSIGAQNSAVLHLSANGFLFIYLFSRFSDAARHKSCTRSGNCLRLHRQQSTIFNRESEHAERSEVSNTPALYIFFQLQIGRVLSATARWLRLCASRHQF